MRLIPAGAKPSPPFTSWRSSPSLCFPVPRCSPGYKSEAWASSPGALSASPSHLSHGGPHRSPRPEEDSGGLLVSAA